MGPVSLFPNRLVEGKLLTLPPKRMLEELLPPKREPVFELKSELLAKRLPFYGFLKSKREAEAGLAGSLDWLLSNVAGFVPNKD